MKGQYLEIKEILALFLFAGPTRASGGLRFLSPLFAPFAGRKWNKNRAAERPEFGRAAVELAGNPARSDHQFDDGDFPALPMAS